MLRREEVVLPEPGRTLLKKTHAILARQFPDSEGEPGHVIGGGTMLAARWRHRASNDIDVRVSNKPGKQLISRMLKEPRLETWLNWAMKQAGAEHRRRLDRYQMIYFFGPMQEGTPRVELLEEDGIFEGEAIRTSTEGMEIWSAANCEILAAKWKWRRHRVGVKDVFDLAVSGLRDGAALQRALGVETRSADLSAFIVELGKKQRELIMDGTDELKGVPDSLQELRDDPARYCAREIGAWAAHTVELQNNDGFWDVLVTCRAEPKGIGHGRFDDVEAASRRMAQLAGLDEDDRRALVGQALEDGCASRPGAGKGLTETTEPNLKVHADGTVTITDFATEAVETPDIESAGAIALARGWVSRDKVAEVTASLRKAQAVAIATLNEREQG